MEPSQGRSRAAARVRRGLAAALLAALGCAAEPARPPSLLLVVVDTLRADRLGCYGAERDTSPSIDALAARGVRFERAYATAPWTKPSIASMITGLHPSSHGARDLASRIPEQLDTLAEILAARGFATAGVVSHVILKAPNGFAQGYATYRDGEARGHEHVSTGGVTAEAIALLDRLEPPFLLFVHYFDPHYDYQSHEDVGFAAPRAGRLDGRQSFQRLLRMRADLTPAELRFLRDRYDEEIRHTDAGIGRLLGALGERGLDRETWVVLTADHGEEFREHGWLGHARSLHEEVVRVPLVIRPPGGTEARTVRDPVSLVSLTPTLLELLGIDPAPWSFQGRSLADAVRGGRVDGAAGGALTELAYLGDAIGTGERWALVEGRHKLIRDGGTGEVQIFDLEADPHERTNLAERDPALRERLEARLEARIREAGSRFTPAPDRELAPSEIELLYQLGYGGS